MLQERGPPRLRGAARVHGRPGDAAPEPVRGDRRAVLSGSRNRALVQVEQAPAALRRDIGRREQVEAQLQQLAFHDRIFAVLFIDLDGCKQIDDQRGHQAGDTVLREVATAMYAAKAAGRNCYAEA
ncbi:diguanylate cyclase [Actinoplanes sp. NPDC051494]|uniref:diguanylate cyclase n=1 Tax=Actinoplanes sp. NPDC051494 TaxID=3363907 RepID=UPI0037A4B245